MDLAVTWVQPARIHLTIKYLGETSPEKIPEIKRRVQAAALLSDAFSLSLGKVGAFPNLTRPRVLWLDLEDSSGQLEPLWRRIDAEMTPLGYPSETRKFSPHLTLGRIKSPKGAKKLKNAILETPRLEADPIEVSAVSLYESQLTPKGPIYTELGAFELNHATERG